MFRSLHFLLDFDFLFHVYFFTLRVSKPVLKEGETLIGNNLDTNPYFICHLRFMETRPWVTKAAMYG